MLQLYQDVLGLFERGFQNREQSYAQTWFNLDLIRTRFNSLTLLQCSVLSQGRQQHPCSPISKLSYQAICCPPLPLPGKGLERASFFLAAFLFCFLLRFSQISSKRRAERRIWLLLQILFAVGLKLVSQSMSLQSSTLLQCWTIHGLLWRFIIIWACQRPLQ